MTKYGDQPYVHVEGCQVVTRVSVRIETAHDQLLFRMLCEKTGKRGYKLARELMHEALRARLAADPEFKEHFDAAWDESCARSQRATQRFIEERNAEEQAKKRRSEFKVVSS